MYVGVESKIVDLSTYVSAIPVTIGFIPGFFEKGPANKITFINDYEQFVKTFGEPNLNKFGNKYGQGAYVVKNYLTASNSIYIIRCLPFNASYSNLCIFKVVDNTNNKLFYRLGYISNADDYSDFLEVDGTYSFSVKSGTSFECPLKDYNGYELFTTSDFTVKTADGIDTYELDSDKYSIYLLGAFVSKYKGNYYNKYSFDVNRLANYDDVYGINVYLTNEDGDRKQVEAFHIGFKLGLLDLNGESVYVEDVLSRYSSDLSFITIDEFEQSIYNNGLNISGYDIRSAEDIASAAGTSVKNVEENENGTYALFFKNDITENIIGEVITYAGDKYLIISVTNLDNPEPTKYIMEKVENDIIDPYYIFEMGGDKCNMTYGNDGRNDDGTIFTLSRPNSSSFSTAKQLLTKAYEGEIDDNLLDLDNIYFPLVFCPYGDPDIVNAVENLCKLKRKDCVGICDLGDNRNADAALQQRLNNFKNDTYHLAFYEPYVKVYDEYTGRDIWLSPVAIMAKIIPDVDRRRGIHKSPAGFRDAVVNVKELRYNCKQGDRDRFYENQINPIVKFDTTVVYGDLTSQRMPSHLQLLPVTRLVLYIDRALKRSLKYYLFEWNDQQTWNQIKNDIVAFLNDLRKKRALRKFNVNVYATEYDIKMRRCRVDIILYPNVPIHKIELTFFIK